MSIKSGRKITGGKYKTPKKKRLTGRQSQTRIVRLGIKKTKVLRGRGGTRKLVSLSGNFMNIISGKKSTKTQIKNVIETPSNTFLARQNVLVKGAIVETDLGKAKITNRPSQEGVIQGILIE